MSFCGILLLIVMHIIIEFPKFNALPPPLNLGMTTPNLLYLSTPRHFSWPLKSLLADSELFYLDKGRRSYLPISAIVSVIYARQ